MGFFPLDGPFARVNREAVLLLGGPRALLLQLAHPLVAAGVEAHSTFPEEPLGRLRRTLDGMLTIIFGDESEARASARRINAVHERVHGELRERTAAFPAGTRYDARDPDLALWVHATLVDSALAAYERFVAPLSPGDRELFYEESTLVAELLLLPADRLPPSMQAFENYVEATIRGPLLEVTPGAARLADAVLHPPVPLLPRALGDVASIVTLGLLPPAVRELYGFPWGERREKMWRVASRAVRGALPLLPELARTMPHARRATLSRARPPGSARG